MEGAAARVERALVFRMEKGVVGEVIGGGEG